MPQQSARPVAPEPVAAASPAPPSQPRSQSDEQLAARNEAQPSQPVEPARIEAPPALPSGPPPTPADPHEQPSSPARASPDAQAPGTSDRESTQPPGPALVPPLVIVHAAESPGGRAAAQQLASAVGLAPDQVDTRAAADLPPRAIIRFYATEDHAWARRLGQALSEMGYKWRIESSSDRSSSNHQVPEIWLPER